jgi:hypothetical protein
MDPDRKSLECIDGFVVYWHVDQGGTRTIHEAYVHPNGIFAALLRCSIELSVLHNRHSYYCTVDMTDGYV